MKRCMSFFLSVAIVFSIVVPIHADNASGAVEVPVVGVLYDSGFVVGWDSAFSQLSFIDGIGDFLSMIAWDTFDAAVSSVGYGGFVSYKDLSAAAAALNNWFSYSGSRVPGAFEPLVTKWDIAIVRTFLDGIRGRYHFRVAEHPNYGYVIEEEYSGLVVCNSSGAFPYYKTNIVVDDGGNETVSFGGKWVREDRIPEATLYNVVNEATLYDIGWALKNTGEVRNQNSVVQFREVYQAIAHTTEDYWYYYCDSQGRPYVYRPDPNQWAQDQENNYYTDDDDDNVYDDGPTEDNQLIDIDENTIWFPDGTIQYIENLLYDESTKTYYVDAHQEYNIENNTYVTNNYHYEYHINHTSITYIGQTEEYDEKYELYFQLPDGRNSADLTAEELQALNTQIDILPYIRSADDTSIRALYHFDADTMDASYWSHMGKLTWNEGASITYMDAGAFNGALYLDENTHDFSVTLPSALGLMDFTVQFRYYQSHTIAPMTDSYITVGGVDMLQLNGASILDGGGDVLAPVSVGNWQEIALMRKGGVVYVFHNGVRVGQFTSSSSLDNIIRFTFGDQQQTYKYLDELRVVDEAIYEMTGYTPTSVPFDTNLALVLPDSQLPVADEYWSFNTEGNLLPVYDFTQYHDPSDYLTSIPKRQVYVKDFGTFSNYTGDLWTRFYVGGQDTYVVDTGYVYGSTKFMSTTSALPTLTATTYMPSNAFSLALGMLHEEGTWEPHIDGVELGKSYSFTVMLADGTTTTVSFDLPENPTADSAFLNYVVVPGGGYIGVRAKYNTDDFSRYNVMLTIFPPPNGSLDIVYMELKEGAANTGHEFVTSVVAMDKDSLNVPSLAVRTDLEIMAHQIGGVRPSLPTKGLVWALVEGSRITSLQIYNGQAWEAVDGRIWTGARWVPYYAYDVLLLKDMYDIIESDPSLDYIYTQEGFWAWLQSAWGQMISRLDRIIEALGGTVSSGSECQHVYRSEIQREATCAEPGHMLYTCTKCGHVYTELIDPTGHDWVVSGVVDGGANKITFVDSIEECVDTTRKYVLPDGYIYEYRFSESVPAYINILNSDNVHLNQRRNSSGALVSAMGYVATDYIPVRVEDVVRINNTNVFSPSALYNRVNFYDSSRFKWNDDAGADRLLRLIKSNGVIHFVVGYVNSTLGNDTTNGLASYCNNIAYMSLNLYISNSNITESDVSELVLTINEEIAFKDVYTWTNTGVLFDDPGSGYDELTCTICGAKSRDYGKGPEEMDLFDALGEFIADGVTWILDKLTELANSLQTITETFHAFVEKISVLAGGFPLFFGAFMALIPEDLAIVFWFAVIGFVVFAVWKKWSE